MEIKHCLHCGKEMKKEDYILYKGYANVHWKGRKYCSKDCERKQNSKRYSINYSRVFGKKKKKK